jgi:hypothetical protein
MRPDYRALLNRAIRDAQSDPAQARRLVYELARVHLRRELWTEFRRIGRGGMHDELMALETAIAHIETSAALDEQFGPLEDHSTEPPLLEGPAGDFPPEPVPAIPAPLFADRPPLVIDAGEPLRRAPLEPPDPVQPTEPRSRTGRTSKALLAVLMLAGTSLIAMGLLNVGGISSWFAPWRQTVADLSVRPADAPPSSRAADDKPGPQPAPAPPPRARPSYPFTLPETYGVYVVTDGQLTQLEPLPIRVPDTRVAISGMISKPPPAPVANGRLFFVVYHRDLTTNAPDKASVRVIAKVVQAMTFAAGGRPKVVPVEDTWAVRAAAYEFRVAPFPENPEMMMIRPADPELALSPGRYALVFKNLAYDFSVAGKIRETVHCLERTDAQNGTVYSECREIPAAP